MELPDAWADLLTASVVIYLAAVAIAAPVVAFWWLVFAPENGDR